MFLIKQSTPLSLLLLPFLCCVLGCDKKSTGANGASQSSGSGKEAGANDSNDLQSKYEKARALEDKGEFENAHALYKEIQTANVDFKDIDARLDGYGELLTLLTELKELEGDPPSIRATFHVDIANFLKGRGTDYYAQAKANYKVAIKLDPMHFGAHEAMADFALKEGQYKDAMALLKKACEIKSEDAAKNAEAHYQLATIFNILEAEEGGSKKEALKYAEQAVKFSASSSLKERRLLAELYFESKAKDKARKLAELIAGMKGATEEDKARLEEYKK